MSIQQVNFKEIADAIRECSGTTDLIAPKAFSKKIRMVADVNYRNGKNAQALEFWKSIQNDGKREDYSYAFARITGTNFEPLYPFDNVSNVQYMFLQASEIVDLSDVVINVTNQNPNLMYMFCNCYKLRQPPRLTFTAPVVKVYTSMFANCLSLEECEIYLGDGTQDPIKVRNSMQNTFFKCENLKHITFSGKGSPLYLDLSSCQLLTQDSLMSLKNALMDVSGAVSGVYTIKLSTDSYNLLTETDIDGFINLGWTVTT